MLGLYMDDGIENGSYYLGCRVCFVELPIKESVAELGHEQLLLTFLVLST